MKFKNLCIALIAAAVAFPVAAADFTIDTAHSSVSFKVSHMVISKTRGSFTAFDGVIHLDDEDVTKSSVQVSIDVATIDTANEDRDKHLRSADFFDVENHPTITFKSTSIISSGDGYIANGDLTIKGVTKKIALPFDITGRITDPWGNERLGVAIDSLAIDRRDFGITWSKTMDAGGLVVGDEVTIELEVEAVGIKKE